MDVRCAERSALGYRTNPVSVLEQDEEESGVSPALASGILWRD